MGQTDTGAGGVDPLGPVFISYRQSDGTPLAVALAWALRAAGVPVWHDQTDLPPGETTKRLQEALASGLSGAILVVTPEIVTSGVVRDVELPALLELAEDPAFTFSIVSSILNPEEPAKLDYGAPDWFLRTPEGTLSAINQSPGTTAAERADVARAQARRRLENMRSRIADAGGELVLDLQTRVPPYAARHDADLVVRLRPPLEGQRRPHAGGLEDLQGFLGQLPQLVAIGGASRIRVRGGAHLSVACAFGAAVPTTLLGSVEVIDTSGAPWLLSGQAAASAAEPLVVPVAPPAYNHDRGRVLVYVDLLTPRSDAAFDDLVASTDFAGVMHLRPVVEGLLEPGRARDLVGEVIAAVRELAGAHGTTEVHLLLRCPYPLALLMGRSLNTLRVHLSRRAPSGVRWVPRSQRVVVPRRLRRGSTSEPGGTPRRSERRPAQRARPGARSTSGRRRLQAERWCRPGDVCWDRGQARHLLVLALSGTSDGIEAMALTDGPNDEQSLLLRAGPDAVGLREQSVSVFGLGALGGHAAVCLASSGVGRLRLVDLDQILPGNVVRHVVGHNAVGVPKVHAVEARIGDHAPWAEVDRVLDQPRTPSRLRELIDDVDFVVDATGSEVATGSLAAVAAAAGKPLVSGAQFRGGAIARVQRQGTPGDVALIDRPGDQHYRLIPPGSEDEELVELAVGCSAPVNNAPPSSVLACTALIAQSAVDVLSGRCALPDEVTDVYRTLDGEPPFDQLGWVR